MPYMQDSMELNLFFLRILKEHALFMQLSFTPKNKELTDQAADLKEKLTALLQQAVTLSKGYISEAVMASGELFTRFTEEAEQQTQFFTGVPVDTQLTREEYNLGGGMMPPLSMRPQVDALNQSALALARQMLQFNQTVLDDVMACRIFTVIYPSELGHLVNEAQHYIYMLGMLMSGDTELGPREFAEEQAFWNMNMGQHAEYIDGSLDPTETALMDTQASGASAPTTVVGEVSKEDGLYYVTDETTGVKFEVQGENLEGLVGQRVSVTGTIVPSSTEGAAQILQVTGVEKLSAGAAAGGSATGMSAAAKTVIAGVAIAGAGTAAGIGLTRGDDDEETPISR